MAINKSRAAGLAALAGLAYAASRGKKGEDTGLDREDADLGAAIRANSASAPASATPATTEDTSDFLSRRLKRNEETGEMYTTDNLSPMSAPSAKSSSKSGSGGGSKSRGASASKARAGEDAARDMEGSSNPPQANTKDQRGPFEGAMRGMRSDARPSSKVGSGSGGGRGPKFGEREAYEASLSTPPADDGMSAYKPRGNYKLSDVIRPGTNTNYENKDVSDMSYKRGGAVKKMASGGMTSSASKRADGIATKGKTRGRIC